MFNSNRQDDEDMPRQVRNRALFNLNALVSSLGIIVPAAYGLGHYYPSSLYSGI